VTVNELPPSSFGLLPRSPLELVVCQVRHEDRELNAEQALTIHEMLGGPDGPLPRVEQVEMQTATVAFAGAVSGPPTTEIAHGWHLKSEDGAWTAALLPGHFSLETTKYSHWQHFRDRLSALAAAVEEVARPTMEQRLGLRYVDRLDQPPVMSPPGWAPWIHPTLMGPLLHPQLAEHVRSVRQQIDFDLGSGRQCVLRHGTVSDAPGHVGTVYLLDFDVYRQQARRFSTGEVLRTAEDFHRQADALFQQVITPDLLSYLASDENE
jgi:uncharacterized protein (TIGR04255 family)